MAQTAGARSFCASMKHVGLKTWPRTPYTMSYIGVNGGMVLGAADDPVCIPSSMSGQPPPCHWRQVPMLEPADSQECKDFTKLAYALSRSLTPRWCFAADHQDRPFQKPGGAADRDERDLKP